MNQGELLEPSLIKRIRCLGAPIVNYTNDNPFAPENRRRFHRYRTALPYYGVIVVVVEHIVELARQTGGRKVIRTYISADEVALLGYGHNVTEKH